MASPVDTSVKFILGTMTGAPVINNANYSGIGALDAFLVDGWGLQTANSLVVSGGVATLTFPTAFPAIVDSVILVAGATPEGLNGEQKVTSIATATNTVRFATTLPDGTATGTITVKMAPAGWSKPLSKTGVAVYKSVDPVAHAGGMYLRVDDSRTDGWMRVRGYETMSDVDTGTGMFPNDTQANGGGWWQRHYSGTNPTRYAIFADSRTILFSPAPYSQQDIKGQNVQYAFGDPLPTRPSGDPYSTLLVCGWTQSDFSRQWDYPGGVNAVSPRAFNGLSGAQGAYLLAAVGSAQALSGNDGTYGSFPSMVDGRLVVSRRRLTAGGVNEATRAWLPGGYSISQNVPLLFFERYSTLDGAGDLQGRKLMVLHNGTGGTSTTDCRTALVDVTGPWR